MLESQIDPALLHIVESCKKIIGGSIQASHFFNGFDDGGIGVTAKARKRRFIGIDYICSHNVGGGGNSRMLFKKLRLGKSGQG